MFWVISYDIPDNRRRRKVSKLLEGYGKRVQFSVFECEIEDDTKRERLERLLKREIDEGEDDIRFYSLNRADLKRVRLLGRATLHKEDRWKII